MVWGRRAPITVSDNIPFPGAASELGKWLGVDDWSNGIAVVEGEEVGKVKLGNLPFQIDSGLVLKNLQLAKPFL
ncbi:MAG: hypothetical protein VXZ82_13230 [Planctomycetota bacterium]|nr:hypothetical protein [Planctomycetota bacterium]